MRWKKVNFTNAVMDITGGNRKFQTSEYLTEGFYPIVDQGDKFICGFTKSDDIVKRKKPVVIFGDHTKLIKYVDFDFCLGADGVKVLEPIDQIDSKFLYYYLSTIKLPNVGYSRHFKFLKEVQIPLPPLPTQRAIAARLDRADALRQKDRQLLQAYDDLAQAVFVEMFGDPVRNEKGWEVVVLKKHANVLTGYPFKSTEYIVDNEGIKLCGGLIISPSEIEWLKANHYPKIKTIGLERYLLQEGDIVLAMDRPWISSGLKIAMINKSDPSALLVQRTARIRAISMNNKYLLQCLKAKSFELHAKLTETTVPHISPTEILSYHFPFPPLPLQTRFASILANIEQQKEIVRQQQAESEALFGRLLQEAFGS